MSVHFNDFYDGYTYSAGKYWIEKYCEKCGVPIEWSPVERREGWKKFDSDTGKRFKYEKGYCPIDEKQRIIQEAKREREKKPY